MTKNGNIPSDGWTGCAVLLCHDSADYPHQVCRIASDGGQEVRLGKELIDWCHLLPRYCLKLTGCPLLVSVHLQRSY